MRRCAAFLLLTLVAVVLATPAWAHGRRLSFVAAPTIEPGRAGATASAATSVESDAIASRLSQTTRFGTLLLLGVAAVIGAAAKSRRRTLITLLLVALVVVVFEAGVHSVHHIGQPEPAARCIVALAASNFSGATSEPVALVAPEKTHDVALLLELGTLPQRLDRSDHGRAPPFPA